jgi:hypothetical protein
MFDGHSFTVESQVSTGNLPQRESSGFWTTEAEPAERRKLPAELFQAIRLKDGRIVSVGASPYFFAIWDGRDGRLKDPKGDPDDEVTKAGATGLEPATSGVTGRRSNQLSYAPEWTRTGRRGPGRKS